MALIVYAPNVHAGGGRVLLEALAQCASQRIDRAIIDMRLRERSMVFPSKSTLLVRNTMASRLLAEWLLWRMARTGDTVLCLHSLPPLLPTRARVVVLVQNRLLIEQHSLEGYPRPTRLRITAERIWARLLQKRCTRYLVQTPSMAFAVLAWLRRPAPVVVMPFAPSKGPCATTTPNATDIPEQDGARPRARFDFVYVASGEAHKNHRVLLRAWQMLARDGLHPSLALTVNAFNYPALGQHILDQAAGLGLGIVNHGELSEAEVSQLYLASGALIFPSLCESFGLPLIEATRHGLPILAGELDFVRDVSEPVETFDARSPVSIARAVKRFMGYPQAPLATCTGEALLEEALR